MSHTRVRNSRHAGQIDEADNDRENALCILLSVGTKRRNPETGVRCGCEHCTRPVHLLSDAGACSAPDHRGNLSSLYIVAGRTPYLSALPRLAEGGGVPVVGGVRPER